MPYVIQGDKVIHFGVRKEQVEKLHMDVDFPEDDCDHSLNSCIINGNRYPQSIVCDFSRLDDVRQRQVLNYLQSFGFINGLERDAIYAVISNQMDLSEECDMVEKAVNATSDEPEADGLRASLKGI